MIRQSTCRSLYLLSMIAGYFSSFHQILNPHCSASSSGRGDVTRVGCPALLPVPFEPRGEGGLCPTVSAGSLWWLPGCKSPHRALSGCKVSVWRRSSCEGECSLSVDMSEGRQTRKNFSVFVLTKNHHIRTRQRACHGSILVLSLLPASFPSQGAWTHSTHPCTLSPTHSGMCLKTTSA